MDHPQVRLLGLRFIIPLNQRHGNAFLCNDLPDTGGIMFNALHIGGLDLDAEPGRRYDSKHVAAVGQIHRHILHIIHVDPQFVFNDVAVDVADGGAVHIVLLEIVLDPHQTRRGLDGVAVPMGLGHQPDFLQGSPYADAGMAAHIQILHVVHVEDAEIRLRHGGRHHRSAQHPRMASGLVGQPCADIVIVFLEIVPLLPDRISLQLGDAAENDPGRFAAGMGVHGLDHFLKTHSVSLLFCPVCSGFLSNCNSNSHAMSLRRA